MYGKIKKHLDETLEKIRQNGLYKIERILSGPQGARMAGNLCLISVPIITWAWPHIRS
jgi:hypothetical protein